MKKKHININWWLSSGGGASYDSDYQTYLDRATTLGYTLPGSDLAGLQNTVVVLLKAASLWTKFETARFYANKNKQIATLNLVSPSTKQATLSTTEPVFTENIGFTGGTSKYIENNWNLNAGSVYARDSAHVFVYVKTYGAAASKILTGLLNGAFVTQINPHDKYCLINSAVIGPDTMDNGANNMSYCMSRTGASVDKIYQNGVLKDTNSKASAALPATEPYDLGRNNTISMDFPSDSTVSFVSYGSGLTDTDAANLHSIIDTYVQAAAVL